MKCRYCGKTIRRGGRRADRSPAYATPPGLDDQADSHPWYCDSDESEPSRQHEPTE